MARKYRRDAKGRFAGGGGTRTSKAPTLARSNIMRSSAPWGTISKTDWGRSTNNEMRADLKRGQKPPKMRLRGAAPASPTGQGRRLPARRSNAPSRIQTQWMKTTAPRGTISKRADSRLMNQDFKSETTAKERRLPDMTKAAWNSTPGSRGRRLPRRRR